MKMQKPYEEMTREELICELRLTSLRRQVTPHFLFNSLSVAMSLTTQSPQKAVKFLRHLALMYRYLLRYGNSYYVTIEQELEMVEQYYNLMSIRHVDSIHLTVMPEVRQLQGYPLPPLALQGLLENAIKHNTHTKEKPLQVVIRVENDCLVIENNIVPLVAEIESTKIGLAYMNETMMLLFNKGISVRDEGKMFRVLIPLIADN